MIRVALFSIFALVFLAGCSSSTPPGEFLESTVVARAGIDDFDGVTVQDLVDAMDKSVGASGGEVIGWKNDGQIYEYHIQMSSTAAPISLSFKPLNNDVVRAYPTDNPSPMAAIQVVRMILVSANTR
jgi:hypothetical protein